MIGRLLAIRRRPAAATPIEVRLDALEAAISVKLQALLVTLAEAMGQAIRAELAGERRVRGATAAQAAPGVRTIRAHSLLELEAADTRAWAQPCRGMPTGPTARSPGQQEPRR